MGPDWAYFLQHESVIHSDVEEETKKTSASTKRHTHTTQELPKTGCVVRPYRAKGWAKSDIIYKIE